MNNRIRYRYSSSPRLRRASTPISQWIFSRVIMAPEHAKRLLFALQENILRYEKEFGEIKLPSAPQAPEGDGRTAMPFGTGKA